ncbi:MAG TPA: thioredoxin family protein [Bacteroidota bacterium]|nr:thioredoxin family protein [Bacteroidota bacterium]
MRAALLLLIASIAFAVARSTPAPHHTSVRLVANVRGIVPGGTFTLGLLMTMDAEWHTYWANPGDAGLATQIKWDVPDGFTPGAIRWPLPHKTLDSGDVQSYAYSGENMLLIPFTAPASLTPGSLVRLKANVSWLECRSICVPGDATTEITLPVVSRAAPPDNERLFASYDGRVPRPLGADAAVAFSAAPGKGNVVLTLTPRGSSEFLTSGADAPDFYPETFGDLLPGRTSVKAEPTRVVMTLPVTAGGEITGPTEVRGVLLYALAAGHRQAAEVHFTLPESVVSESGTGSRGVSILDRNFTPIRTGEGTQPLLLYIAFALLGGVLLNIMPCVLPVIALKVFGLVRMAGDEPAKVKRLGVSFAAGILASFLALAAVVILLQFAGQQVGWGFQFQEPRFVIAMAALVFAFGLSLFGVFEITLPGAAVTGISAVVAARKGNGYGASFGEGVFATVLATPCTAPFLGSALGFAFAQPWWTILLIFTCVAIGMALPYLVLTSRPAWIRFLPKPGAWMVSAQQLMGFLMMATLLWLLYVLGKQMGMEAVIWTGAFLLCVGLACWLVGRYATLTASRRTWWVTWTAALLIVVGGYLFFLVSVLDLNTALAVQNGTTTQPNSGDGIAWTQFSLAGLDEDLRGNRPVFLDFTAEWCLTCKVNEKTVLGTRDVIDRFRSMNILPVRADWTNRNPDITKLLAKFGRSGVPLYVVFPPGKPDSAIVLPEVITSGIVLDALTRASQ